MGLADEMRFGKHRGKTLKEVLDTERDYITWAINNMSDFTLTDEAHAYWSGGSRPTTVPTRTVERPRLSSGGGFQPVSRPAHVAPWDDGEGQPTVIANLIPEGGVPREVTTPSGKQITLNDQQHAALVSMLEWAGDSSKTAFTLSGYAGTGKTTIVFVFLHYLTEFRRQTAIAVSAPTHKAKKVIQRATGRPSHTIQSLLGLAPFVELEEFDPNKPQFARKNDPKITEYDYVIIDEASMMNTNLFDILVTEAEMSATKIVFMGDAAQLPPVGEAVSKVFTSDKIDVKAELTRVERQADGNPLMPIYDAIRSNTKSTVDLFPHVSKTNEAGEGRIFLGDQNEWLDRAVFEFKSTDYERDTDHAKLLAWTNQRVKDLNISIRRKLHGDEVPPLVVGEVLMGYRTVGHNDSILIENSADYRVIAFEEFVSEFKMDDKTTREIGMWHVKLAAADVPQTKEFEGESGTRMVKIVQPTPENYATFVEAYEEELKKAKAAKGRYERRQAWSEYYGFKDQHLLLHDIRRDGKLVCRKDLDYAYAITVHKSQGSTYTYAFVDETDLNKNSKRHEERNNLKYVAISRPSKIAIILSSPSVIAGGTQERLNFDGTPVGTYATPETRETPGTEETAPPSESLPGTGEPGIVRDHQPMSDRDILKEFENVQQPVAQIDAIPPDPVAYQKSLHATLSAYIRAAPDHETCQNLKKGLLRWMTAAHNTWDNEVFGDPFEKVDESKKLVFTRELKEVKRV